MGERRLPAGYHRSVFFKLVAIMIAMATILLGLVVGFFFHYVGPSLNESMYSLSNESMRLIADSAPDLDQARGLAARLDLEIRYEGPAGAWTTAPGVPSVAELRAGDESRFDGSRYAVAPAPDGGSYVFAWTIWRRLRRVHTMVITLLVVLMVAVIFAAHVLLQRLLRPLRGLADGVARLSEGELDVELANPTRDEFGALTDAFNQMVGRIRGMIRARDQLLLDVSHELRSPLTRLKVALELLPAPPDGPTERGTREGMAADLAEMEVMIGELLELERLEEGGIRTAPTDLVALADAVAAAYRDRPPGVQLAVQVDADPGALVLDLDADKMRMAIRNLVENGVKYSLPDSRPVEVSVEVSVAAAGERVVVRVTDDGPGVPDDEIASVFEPFFRVDRSRSKKTGGYGLGLSIARRIVEAHGGSLTLSNNPGRGATFEVTLPAGEGGLRSS